MRIKSHKRLGALICAFGIALWMLAGVMLTAFAETGKGSLTLVCVKDDTILTGLHWDLYRVGSRSGNEFVLENEFSEYQVKLDDFSASAMNTAAKTLENYAVLDGISPRASGETDSKGVLKFNQLEEGLYLVSGLILTIGDTTYIPSTLLFEINHQEDSVELNAYPKIIYRTLSSEVINYTVKKLWQNSENQIIDEETGITVEIYRDRSLYKTVVLNGKNNWSYSWGGAANFEWRVKEKEVPADCTVIYDSNETQFAIVNTFNKTITPEQTTPVVTGTTTSVTSLSETTISTPIGGGSITNTNTNITSSSSLSTNAQTSVTVSTSITTDKLPQTGQLWWPVPILCLSGITMIALGIRIISQKKEM